MRLLVKGDLDLPKAAEWLKRHVHIDCDELTPGDIPVVVHGVAAVWRNRWQLPCLVGAPAVM